MSLSYWAKSLSIGFVIGVLGIAFCRSDSPRRDLSEQHAQADHEVAMADSMQVPENHDRARSGSASKSMVRQASVPYQDSYVQLCDGVGYGPAPDYTMTASHGETYSSGSTSLRQEEMPSKPMRGVDQHTPHAFREPRWRDGGMVPWEQYAYGEYLGPYRTPHVDEYRIRIGDQLELNFLQVRHKQLHRYQLHVGDAIQIISEDPALTQPPAASSAINGLQIMPDGTVSLSLIGQVRAAGKTVEALQKELNEKYLEFVKNPSIVVQVTKSDTPVADFLEAVDSRFGQGGRSRQVQVSPDGTIQLLSLGSIPAIGLTLNELQREINARFQERLQGIEVTPILSQRAPRFVYVLGEVRNAGRHELNAGPTSAIQAIALAGGFDRRAGNLRQIIVFRRDHNWQLIATKLDLSGALSGRSPQPSDEIWLRDSDIIIIPAKPIQRLSDAVNLYMTTTLYAIFPQQGVAFNFDSFRGL